MRDPIETLKNELEARPFRSAEYQQLIGRRLEELEQAQQAVIGIRTAPEQQRYAGQRLEAWAAFEQQGLMPHYQSADFEARRVLESLHLIYAETALIGRGLKTFNLQSGLMGDMQDVLRQGVVQAQDKPAEMPGDYFLEQWKQGLTPMTEKIQEAGWSRASKKS